MNMFAIRIELNGPPPREAYTDLHDLMECAGFERKIRGNSGHTYKLPKGLYCGLMATDNSEAVRNYLMPIVAAVEPDYELAVFRFSNAAWAVHDSDEL
jgi:hypothetical protein